MPAAFTLAELAAMVVISGYDPNFINPEAFRQNGIVDGGWSPETPAVVGGSRTSFHYTNGVTVWANPDFLVVTQKGDSLQVSECQEHQVVSRYVEIAPDNVFHAVGFDLQGSIRLPEGAGLSPSLDQRLMLGDTQPALEMKATYEQEGKELILFWSEHLRGCLITKFILYLKLPDSLLKGTSECLQAYSAPEACVSSWVGDLKHWSFVFIKHPLRGYIRLHVPEANEERESQQAFVKDVLAHREHHLQEFWSLIHQLADLYQPREA